VKTTSQLGMYWVIGTLTVAMLPQLASTPPHLLPLILFPLAWRLAAELRHWKPFPAVLRIALTVLSVAFMIFTYGGLMGRRAAVGLLAVMLSLKLLEAFRVRDARIVASLSLFLCATQFLFSQGLFMLLYGAIATVCALVALAYLHRRESFQPVGEAPPSGHSLFAELGFSARLLALAIPVALAVFLLFPRWGTPLWGIPEEALDARSGLSNSMSPGSIQNLFMDDTPAFRADSRPAVRTSPWRYTVQMEPTEQHWLFALDYPSIVPQGSYLTLDYQLYSPQSVTQLRSYEMASDPRFVDTPRLSNTLRRAALALPEEFNPRTRRLIRSWRADTTDDVELVNRVLAHFNRESFRYTLNPPLLSRNTVDEFMFETRSGFCEHYASAFTVMMRMAGIPARVVTGYLGGWYNEFGDYLLVRQSDAHAWSEIWLRGSGWTRIDPTAAVAPNRVESGALDALAGRRHLLDFAWLRDARNGFDFLQRRWNEWVIAFNSERQASLFMPLGMGRMDSTRLVALMVLSIGLLFLLLLPAILRLRQVSERDPAVRLWLKFRRRLARAGIEAPSSVAPLELAAAALEHAGDDGKDIERIARLYHRLRYAPGAPGFDEFASAVRAFRPARGPA
jgi:transglutaminase-like putative cysteine protease